LKYFNFKDPKNDFGKTSKQERAMSILGLVKRISQESWKIISDSESFYKGLLEFAAGRDNIPDVLLREMKNSSLILPLRKYLDPVLPKRNSKPSANFNPFHPKPQYILW